MDVHHQHYYLRGRERYLWWRTKHGREYPISLSRSDLLSYDVQALIVGRVIAGAGGAGIYLGYASDLCVIHVYIYHRVLTDHLHI